MDLGSVMDYCLVKKGVTQEFPFDSSTLVFKVAGKIFAMINLQAWENNKKVISLKCDPLRAQELRDTYIGIQGAYHMNKKHWNGVDLSDTQIKPHLLCELIDHSYEMVYKGLSKKLKQDIDLDLI